MRTDHTERGLRAALVVVCLVGVRDRNPGAVMNGAIALACSYLPGAIERRCGVTFRPWQRLYVESGLITHAVGMLGPYDDVWWWDHVTHAHSASVLGGVVHVLARRRGRDPGPRVLGAVVGGGALWEVGEYAAHAVSRRLGIEPLLVHYGPRDTAVDLLFDLVGASVVVAAGDALLGNFLRGGPSDRPESDGDSGANGAGGTD